MRVIIAGSRDIIDYEFIKNCINTSQFKISEIVCGYAHGVDLLGKRYGQEHNISVAEFPADWSTHGKSAGFIRNSKMAKYGEALIAIWDGKSRGTKNMINQMKTLNKPVETHIYSPQKADTANLPNVDIYTDGSCLTNPGNGGCAALLMYGEHQKLISQGFKETTNNRMEMRAIIIGLEALNKKCNVKVYTDSQYIANSINKKWINNWKVNNWKTKQNKDVKNKDLWLKILELLDKHIVDIIWIKGHNNHKYNDMVDEAAQNVARKNIELLAEDNI